MKIKTRIILSGLSFLGYIVAVNVISTFNSPVRGAINAQVFNDTDASFLLAKATSGINFYSISSFVFLLLLILIWSFGWKRLKQQNQQNK